MKSGETKEDSRVKLGRYEILEEIGKGSMGVVYKAHDPNLDLVVALKVLREDRLADEAVARRFLAEAKALGRLDHPGTVRVFNVDREGGTVYIAMEFVEGQSLGARMKQERFSAPDVAELGTAVAEALGDAHRRGIVHRDVKPGNILLRADGRVKITDFGIAHIDDIAQEDKTRAGEILGTPGYMSPEQVRGEAVDGRSDLFSLGIILYELATGIKPFAGENLAAVFYAITQKAPERPDRVNPEIPKGLGEVILKCLAKEPGERYPSAQELADALRSFLPSPQAVPAEAKPAPRAPAALWAAAAVGAAALVGGALLAVRPGTAPSRPAPSPPADSLLKIESEPLGAQVFVDGGFQGRTPAGLKLTAGKHEVRLVLEGHQDWEAQVQLKDKTETPLQVQLAPVDPGAGTK